MRSDSVATTDRLCSTIRMVRFVGDAPDQRGDALDVLLRHAGHRLVEQHHLGVERQRRGDLQRALAAVGQLDRRRAAAKAASPTASISSQRVGVEMAERPLRAPEVEGVAALPLQRDAHVLQHGQMREHRRDLERADEAEPGDVGRRHAR